MRGLLNYDKACFQSLNYYGFPEVAPYTGHIDCKRWIDFDSCLQDYRPRGGLHFFIDDYKFQRIWDNPKKYINLLSRYDYVVQPDFSLYYNFPVSLQIFNKFRNHWLSAFYSVNGISMIPNISPSVPDCYDWSFLGYPKNSVVAFSDVGAIRDKESKEITRRGYDEMIKRLEPSRIIYFTRSKASAPSEADVVVLPFKKGECS